LKVGSPPFSPSPLEKSLSGQLLFYSDLPLCGNDSKDGEEIGRVMIRPYEIVKMMLACLLRLASLLSRQECHSYKKTQKARNWLRLGGLGRVEHLPDLFCQIDRLRGLHDDVDPFD
jgi:hypothetical protein